MPKLASCILIAVGLISGCAAPKEPVALGDKPNPRICQPVPAQGKGQWGACIHRIAYKYARATDQAETVAKAVSSSCGEPLAELLNATEKEKRVELGNAVMVAMDSLALQKVIEARAGHCEVPE
jgi:hypothetical protein